MSSQDTPPLADEQLAEWEALCDDPSGWGNLAVRTLIAEVRRLRAQLPEGMEHCTIVFKSCPLGHGRLTATNWVQHGCPTCAVAAERERAARILDAEAHANDPGPHNNHYSDVGRMELCRRLAAAIRARGQQ